VITRDRVKCISVKWYDLVAQFQGTIAGARAKARARTKVSRARRVKRG
jgi:hypothetical protein